MPVDHRFRRDYGCEWIYYTTTPSEEVKVPEFKVGDEVLIVRKVSSYSEGWNNCWAESMDRFVNNGIDYVVTSVSRHGVSLARKGGGYSRVEDFGWPPHGLTRLSVIGTDLFDV